ncbi:hypothetical protein K438DRAFT_1782893 [Mycena galopus ATCC 62051]|nr:hypothetical protein K438DRAFT_1782893 [Mycena galopus ATCC 62051]
MAGLTRMQGRARMEPSRKAFVVMRQDQATGSQRGLTAVRKEDGGGVKRMSLSEGIAPRAMRGRVRRGGQADGMNWNWNWKVERVGRDIGRHTIGLDADGRGRGRHEMLDSESDSELTFGWGSRGIGGEIWEASQRKNSIRCRGYVFRGPRSTVNEKERSARRFASTRATDVERVKLGSGDPLRTQEDYRAADTPTDSAMSQSPAADDRRPRETSGGGGINSGRAASQPPRQSTETSTPSPKPFMSPTAPHPVPGSSPWGGHGLLGASASHRSASFSAGPRFASTFEDDELLDPDDVDELYDARYHSPTSPHPPHNNLGYRGRTSTGPDLTRSRSQSLATSTATAIGAGRGLGSAAYGIGSAANSYSNAYLYGNNAYGHPYGGGGLSGSLSGSLGGRYTGSPLVRSGSVSSSAAAAEDGTNMSPFMRDVLLDDGSFRELWERERGGGGRDFADRERGRDSGYGRCFLSSHILFFGAHDLGFGAPSHSHATFSGDFTSFCWGYSRSYDLFSLSLPFSPIGSFLFPASRIDPRSSVSVHL